VAPQLGVRRSAPPVPDRWGRPRLLRIASSEALRTRLFLVPVTVVAGALFAYPFARDVYLSFTNYNGYSSTKFVGLANYTALFSQSAVSTGLSFTLMYAAGTTVLVTVIAIPLAVMLNKRFASRNVVRAALFFPAIPSVLILGLVWAYILAPISSGAINSLIGHLFGVGPVPWLSSNLLARLSVIGVGVWSQAGWHAVLYLAYLQSIPAEYYEAAEVDGATFWGKFLHITLPQLAPAMTVSCVLLLTNGLNVYALPLALTSGGPGYDTYTVTQNIIALGVNGDSIEYGQASALAVVFLLLIVGLLIAQVMLFRRRELRLR
jgi:multiple sugar transport system permease protein/raffinose/stachyose/melibiose transport system permease protein